MLFSYEYIVGDVGWCSHVCALQLMRVPVYMCMRQKGKLRWRKIPKFNVPGMDLKYFTHFTKEVLVESTGKIQKYILDLSNLCPLMISVMIKTLCVKPGQVAIYSLFLSIQKIKSIY